ncbi:helix-turn-helix transcriptional regulator [Amycolatopsis jiangsuensis]|uniref:DNA-binding CsgD family transcriptional regulator n=1 Tax=Amycolatopsis jiangsuensis TaxID=1181879 RepID=A0A840IR01_9PSEU|nr:LuxR C-terminal-related transcriptional regulator [Amycolatopsis jiangsuensis]MBB4683807.1 DNA-binding CsgD family transcriptional regulator [Amycolatopsis jiangsuensis]
MGGRDVPNAGPDDALAVLDRLLAGPGAVWVVRGPAGAGRSAALAALAERGARAGAAVLAVPAGADPATALTRLGGALAELLTAPDRPEPASRSRAAMRLRSRLRATPGSRPLLVAGDLLSILSVLTPVQRLVLLFDDFDRFPPEVAAVLALVAEGGRAAGAVTVATAPGPEPSGGPAGRLLAVADGTVDLRPLTDAETTALLPAWTTAKGRTAVDPGLVTALRRALGPLFGNPGTVQLTVAALRDGGRLAVVDDHVCLADPERPITLPAEHPLSQRLRRLGAAARRLAAVVAVFTEQQGAELDCLAGFATAAGLPLSTAGPVLDDLVRVGVLRLGGGGAVDFAVPALADRLRLERGPRWHHELHAGAARRLLALRRAGVQVEPAAIARHLAELLPSTVDTEAAGLLLTAAGAADPATARRYRVCALRLLDPGDPRCPAALREVLESSFATGEYRSLADDLATVLAPRIRHPGFDVPTAATAFVWWLAALAHEHRLPELDVVRPLATTLGTTATRLADAVGRNDRAAVAAAAHALDDSGTGLFGTGLAVLLECLPGDRADGPAAEAAGVLDFVSVLDARLSGRYHPPETGFAAGWHAVRRAYRAGEWDTALSLARALEGGRLRWKSPRRHRFASVVAAEISAQRGEQDRAAGWLRRVPCPESAAYVACVRTALRRFAGNLDEALERGWEEYAACRAQGVYAGAEFLLARLLRCARSGGNDAGATRLLAELERLAEYRPTASVRETLLVYGGLVREDETAVRAGLELARQAGDVFRIAQACLALGELSAAPEVWLLEAHRTLKRLGAVAAIAPVTELLDRRRIAVPRDRADRAALAPQERRIAELVADGRTNRQIAAALRISEKRVEARLTAVFERTGCHSRVELAAAWLQGRLTAAPVPA